MNGILSLTTYAPLIGVAAILALRMFAVQDDPKTANAAKWIALATTLATFALSVVMVAGFHPRQPASSMARTSRGSPDCATAWASTASRCFSSF